MAYIRCIELSYGQIFPESEKRNSCIGNITNRLIPCGPDAAGYWFS